RALVERRGGTLLVESRPGLWTRTTVRAPFAPSLPEAAWGPAADGDRAPVPAHDPEGSLSILVVDDNPALRSVVRRFLERRGHRVAEAADGDEALGMVRGAGFDRLVVDVRMPGTDGPALYEALGGRARTLRDRVVFMTGAHVDDGTERFLAESGRPCIRKPFDLELRARAVEEGGAPRLRNGARDQPRPGCPPASGGGELVAAPVSGPGERVQPALREGGGRA